ncbi:MAG TPA: hypothetical protein ENN30_02115 [Candidatus Woesearchaeota archaeon]|nr:hypothetical protein [Candidatus Woesearchaeota archaeon]
MRLFVVSVDDRPGALAEICEVVKPAKIKYIATQKAGYGKGFVKIVTNEDSITEANLRAKGFMFIEEPLILAKTEEGNSSAFYEMTSKLSSQGLNIENLFMFEPGVLAMIINPQDAESAKKLLGDRVVRI